MKQFNMLVDYFGKAVSMAVEDMFDATHYIIEHAAEWHIDTKRIILSGSSAGAITALQGEYEICNGGALALEHLPPDFRYAAVISFAGAIFSPAKLQWQKTPAPVLFYHGDADRNVPYSRIKFMKFKFYGPLQIVKDLDEMKAPYCFHTFENAEHEISTVPMKQNLDETKVFLDRYVNRGERLRILTTEKAYDKPEKKKNIKFADFLKVNLK